MVKKFIQEIITFLVKIVHGNYKLFEKNIWPPKSEHRTATSGSK
jgi:hypothetical protein